MWDFNELMEKEPCLIVEALIVGTCIIVGSCIIAFT